VTPESDLLANVRVVLVETSHPGNIGAAARAMKTMGLSRLCLVAPRCYPQDAAARAMASGADDILAAASVVDSLDAALGECVRAVAATARNRELGPPTVDARTAAAELAAAAGQAQVALVFGNETSGLSNEQLRRCDLLAHIPSNPAYSSLNLGAAVQVFCYEMRMALASAIPAPAGDVDRPATRGEVEALLAHAESALAAIGFHDPANPKRLLPRLRRLAARARLEHEEINILRGMLAYAARAGGSKD
jgi:tRNA/rRNA methyltransferase